MHLVVPLTSASTCYSLHQRPNEDVDAVRERGAALSGSVFAAAAAGDSVAAGLIENMVDVLADHVRAVHAKLGAQPTTVGFHGGLFADLHAETLLLAPLYRNPVLDPLPLRFETLGVQITATFRIPSAPGSLE